MRSLASSLKKQAQRVAIGIAIFLASTAMANAENTKIVKDTLDAANWAATALPGVGYKADFTLDSLKEIDRLFDEQAPEGTPKPGGLLSDQLGSRIFVLGAYVGEVIRRHYGGEWQGDDADPRAEINVAVRLKSGTILWPMQRVMKRFKNGPEDGIYVYGRFMEHQ
jgi:hypothetical protein